jgi:phosphoribosylformylglycinamidine cyclo-ligase
MAHITGGGLTENLPRVLPDDLGVTIDLQRIPALPIMAWLAQAGGISEAEMLKTFNCGIGMILAVAPAQAVAVEAALKAQGTSPVRLGEVTLGQGVTYMGQLSF